MRKTICPYCGKTMHDPDYSERHRCQFCKQFFDGWKQELHEELKKHLPNGSAQDDENMPTVT